MNPPSNRNLRLQSSTIPVDGKAYDSERDGEEPSYSQLRSSEMRYRRLFESARDGILIINPETQKIIDANPFMSELLGYSRDELLGKQLWEIGMLSDEAANQATLQLLIKTNYIRYEDLPLMSKTGTPREVEFVSNLYQEGDQQVIQCNIRDITEKKVAQRRANLLDTCIANLNDIILITDASPLEEPGPKIVFVNDAFERITGYSSSDAIGRSPRFLQGKKTDHGVLREIHQALVQEQPIRRQVVNYRKNGTEYLMDIDMVPVLNGDGKCTNFVAIEHDITEQKLAEHALVASERKFRMLFDLAIDGIFMVRDGVFVDCNPKGLEIFGATREQLIGNSPASFSPPSQPDGRNSVEKAEELHQLTLEGFPQTFAWDQLRLDGTLIHTDVSLNRLELGDVVYVHAVVRDVSARRRAEEQIAEQASLLDQTQDAIIVRDLEGRILFWNKGAERMYGWTSQEVKGIDLDGFLEKNPKKFSEVNNLTIKNDEWSGELQHFTRDGTELTIESRWTLIRGQDGQPKSTLAINTDITDRKKIEGQFLRSQRMESIGTLAGGIAHDLNNILAPILMSIELLKTPSDSSEKKTILDTIEGSAKRGADIVRQVLSFARGMEGERIEVQPKQLLKDLALIIRDTFPKDIRLNFSVPGDSWTILGDPTQIHQVLLNLCVNARDAMPNGGNLSISVENCILDEQYLAMNLQAKSGRYLKFIVTDSGMGIPATLIDKIFEPFFTTKELNKGTGLGLSTVAAIVKSHGGVINVYSDRGKGTVFTIYLQAMEISSQARKEQTEHANLPRGNDELILVVDDEVPLLTITSRTLTTFGYRVLTAVDGADALGIYLQHKNEISAVVTDMMMPVMDGPAMIHALIKINPAIKIVAASGLNMNGSVAKASGEGVKHFLTKPYTAGTLLKTLRTILDEA
jgi:PAS domain S-box-containing protein